MANEEIDWSQYQIKEEPEIDWSQYAIPQQEQVPQQSENWFTKPRDWGILGSVLAGAERGFSELPLGILQLALNNPQFVQEENARRNEAYDIEKENNPMSAMLGYGGSKIAEALPGILGGPAAAGALMSKAAPNAPKFATYLAKALATPAAGAARGAAEFVEPEDSRSWNAIKGALTNTVAKGAGNFLGGGYKLGKSLFKTHPAEDFAKRITGNMNKTISEYGKKYNEIIHGNKNISTEIPKMNVKDILGKANKDERLFFKKFLENPTIGNAHSAQSDLGKLITRLGKLRPTTSVSNAKNAAEKARTRLQKAVSSGLEKAGKPELGKQYKLTTKGYAKDVIPYKESRAIQNLEKGELTPEAFRKALSKESKFEAKMGQELYPELYMFPEAAKMMGKGLGGLGAYSVANYLGLGK